MFDTTDIDANKFPRSLILFWMIENEQTDMFKFLWNEIGYIDWGLINLEWIITVLSYNRNNEYLKLIFSSSTFSKILREVSIDSAMNFLEEFILHNL